jgi:four helix bundle protein
LKGRKAEKNSGVRIQNFDEGMERQPAKTFTDLIVWQKSHQFVLAVYKLTDNFPRHEAFGLTSQLRRAAVSIPANIAEGFKRRGKQEKKRFLNIAQASLEECRYYLILAKDLKYRTDETLMVSMEEVSKLLNAYENSIQNSIPGRSVPSSGF